MNLIEIKNLSFGYSKSHNTIYNIDLTVKSGDFVCIVGENGSGKSTLIKCILGLNTSYSGEIIISERVGYLPQMTEIQNNFPASIEEIVLSGTISNNVKKIWYSKEDKELATNIMKDLELFDIRKKCFKELSGGQKQRVLIARAMCSTGKLLILDEPVNGLDPQIAIQIYKTLHTLNREKNLTIVMVSHDIDRALDYTNKVIEITNGKITFNDISSKYILGGGR